MKNNPLIGHTITIDGPSASGKGTLAKRLSKHFRTKYLDTGVLYRTAVHNALLQNIDLTDTAAVAAAAAQMEVDFRHIGQNQFATFLNDDNVEAAIRTPEVEKGIPLTAPKAAVRAALLERQQNFAQKWQNVYGVILDGRDCGARIAPHATVKIFIVADARVRATRRVAQLAENGIIAALEDIHKDMLKRDERDAPNTIQTPDAVVLDATSLNADEIEAAAIAAINAKIAL